MKSRDSNINQKDKKIHWVVDKIFVLPTGHEEVSNLLKGEFLEKYKAQLKQIDLTDPANLVEQLTNLANSFLLEVREDKKILSKVQQIYEKAIKTEVAKIPKTDKRNIKKDDASKRLYSNQMNTTPVKDFVARLYLSGEFKNLLPENFESTLLGKLGNISTEIFEQELKFISATIGQKDKFIAEFSNHELEVSKKQDFDSRVDKMISNLDDKPFFVINTPMYVPVNEQNLAESSDEELDGEYSLDDLKVPTYYIKSGDNAERGKLLKHNLQRTQLSYSSNPSSYVDPFLEKMKFEGWTDEFTGNAFAVIGLNRPRSLSSARNQALHDEFNSVTTSDFSHEVKGFFWDRTWYKGKLPETKITYAEVRKFYKQLKRVDRGSAEDFRKQNEGNGHIPYQDIRDRLKESEEAAKIVHRIREKSPRSHVYLSLTDSDTIHFNGIYTEYENFVVTQDRPPHVMSTGYEFSDDPKDYDVLPEDLISKLANLSLASKIDRAVRIETAKLNPTGVYYPEPNTCMLIPKTPEVYDKLPYTFLDYSKESKGDEESAIALRRVIASGKTRFTFIDGRPLITALPFRSYKRVVSGAQFQFSAELSNATGYTEDDLKNLAEITQSHFYYNLWARNLEKNNPESVKDGQTKHGILTDLFNYFKATILEGKESFKTDKKEVTRDSIIDSLRENYSEDECANLYQAAKRSMQRVKSILGSRAEYLKSNTSYQPFAKGKYISAEIAKREAIHPVKRESRLFAEAAGKIGLRKIDGYSLQDVDDDGNCFYYAVVEQLKVVAPDLVADTIGFLAHTLIRMKVQKERFKDKEWADESHFNSFVQNYPVALAIIDTRHPANGFNNIRYFDGQQVVHVVSLDEILPDIPVVKIAATGNHFLSVTSTPQNNLGAAARISTERQSSKSSVARR